MPIEIYFVDGSKRPEDFVRKVLREALTDHRLMPLETNQDAYGPSNQGKVYKLIVEEVKPKDQS